MIKDLIKSGKPLVDAESNPIRSNAAYHPERLKNGETKAESRKMKANPVVS